MMHGRHWISIERGLLCERRGPDFYDIAPLKYNGWQEYKAGVKELLQGYSALMLVPNNDLKIGRHGKIAWTTLTFHLVGTQKKSDVESRHTAIWEKRKGEWLIIHEHVSVPLPSGPAAQ